MLNIPCDGYTAATVPHTYLLAPAGAAGWSVTSCVTYCLAGPTQAVPQAKYHGESRCKTIIGKDVFIADAPLV